MHAVDLAKTSWTMACNERYEKDGLHPGIVQDRSLGRVEAFVDNGD